MTSISSVLCKFFLRPTLDVSYWLEIVGQRVTKTRRSLQPGSAGPRYFDSTVHLRSTCHLQHLGCRPAAREYGILGTAVPSTPGHRVHGGKWAGLPGLAGECPDRVCSLPCGWLAMPEAGESSSWGPCLQRRTPTERKGKTGQGKAGKAGPGLSTPCSCNPHPQAKQARSYLAFPDGGTTLHAKLQEKIDACLPAYQISSPVSC